MKVGLLSMQQITNYGSFLQAYGLKSMIENLGNSVEFINIIPGEQFPQYKRGNFYKIKLMLNRLKVKNPLKQIKYTLKLHKRFDNEFKPELGVSNKLNESHFDTVVIGSDEVFNVAQATWFGFSPQLFGEGINADKVITYAGCFGATTEKKLVELKIYDKVKELMSRLDAISIRDENSKEIVKSLIGIDPELNIDPVLAYGFDNEIRSVPRSSQPYVIIYTYPGRMNRKEEINAIKEYCKKNNLKIISIAHYFDWVDEVVTPHPFEVLDYFKKASCIITDTFHGSVMSIKYNRPFVVIIRQMNNNKLTYLLKQFGLDSRAAKNPEDIEKILSKEIDYRSVNEIISREQKKSLGYLQNNLK